jgi:aminopeptidase YwaD
MFKRMFVLTIFVFLLSGCAEKIQEFVSSDITTTELQQHIKYLTSDKLEGRRAGEPGNVLAADYIARCFKQYGLHPAGDSGSYLQSFQFIASTKIGQRNALSVITHGKQFAYTVENEFKPLTISADTTLTAPLVFAGYGISAADSLQYDDYAGIDVKNKIVCILRYSPDSTQSDKYSKYSGIMTKLFTARNKGAAGVIFLTAPPVQQNEKFIVAEDPRLGGSDIATLSMKWSAFETVLKQIGKDLGQIQRTIDSSQHPLSFELPDVTISVQTQIEKVRSTTSNVVGYLPGTDSTLRNEYLVVGGHFDHLGMGGEGSGSLKPDTIAIHHGADDNASGTAGVLELAQYFSTHRNAFRRSIIFITFTGEELGVLGSDYYVKHPFVPLENTIAMINMDMIGRMKDSVLVIEGMGTSPEFTSLVKRLNSDSLKLSLKPDGFGPSDQASFYKKDLPVIFFFTNLHSDYHKPSDTWDKINYFGEQKVTQFAERIAEELSNQEKKPSFTKVITTPMGGGDRQGAKVSLGIIPDFAGDTPGMKISGTRPGSPAEKAGLKGDDVIIKFGGKEIKNIYDFTYMLGQFKPGDEVAIVVKRGNDEITLKAVLQAK